MRPAGRPFLADETQGLAFAELVPWNIYSFASNPAKPPLIKGGLRAFSPPLIRGDGGGDLNITGYQADERVGWMSSFVKIVKARLRRLNHCQPIEIIGGYRTFCGFLQVRQVLQLCNFWLSGASKLSGFVAHDLSGIIPYQGGAE